MRRLNFIQVAATLIALLAASLACDLPVEFAAEGENLGATETMHALATRVAGTLEPDSKDQGASEPGDSQGEPVASSPTVTLTPTVTPTPTLGVPMVSVSVDTNCRFGPGDVYEYQGALMVGEEAEVVGKLSNESFWYITNPDAPPPYCWIWGMYAQVVGDKSGIPILTPPPTPTPTPVPLDFTVSIISSWNCYIPEYCVRVKIENTGEVAFESYTVKVEDTMFGETGTRTGDVFHDVEPCVVCEYLLRLDPGKSRAIDVGLFSSNCDGHNLHVTMKLCTQDGLGGDCVQKTFEGSVPYPGP